MKLRCRGFVAASRDVRIAAVGFFVTYPVFLWAWTGFGEYFYVADRKYYIPLLPLAVFIAYAFAFRDRDDESKIQALVRKISLGYVTGYVCIAATWVALLVLPIELGSRKRATLMGTREFRHWPSMKINYEFSPTRSYVVALLKDKPGTVLVTNRDDWFYADSTLDRSRIRRLKDLRATYVSGPAHILIAVEDYVGGPEQAVSWYPHYDRLLRADYFQHVPGIRLLRKFPEENFKILEVWIPDGARIALNKETTEVELN